MLLLRWAFSALRIKPVELNHESMEVQSGSDPVWRGIEVATEHRHEKCVRSEWIRAD